MTELQEKLAAKTGAAAPTGVFDRKTLGDVIRWQTDQKIGADGNRRGRRSGKARTEVELKESSRYATARSQAASESLVGRFKMSLI